MPLDVLALAHAALDFNAPLSVARANAIVEDIAREGSIASAVDFGCGWGELLLRVVAATGAQGLGIDTRADAIARAASNVRARGLEGRARFLVEDAARWRGEPVDLAIAIGASHAWGGTAAALDALRERVRPGGRVLLGDPFWERAPEPSELAALGAGPGDHGSLADLVDLAIARSLRPLAISVASLDEWDAFESRWCGGLERWLASHAEHAEAPRVREIVDSHRTGYLRGYRGVLGFAYLTLLAT